MSETIVQKQRATFYLAPSTRRKLRLLAAHAEVTYSEALERLIEGASNIPSPQEARSRR